MLRFFLYLWVVVIYTVMWMPMPGDTPALLGQMDLLIHFGLFLILGGLGWLVFRNRFGQPRANYWLILMSFVALSAELGQSMFPTRSVSLIDIVINFAGFFSGAYICKLVRERKNSVLACLLSGGLFLGVGALGGLFVEEIVTFMLFSSLPGGLIIYMIFSVLSLLVFLATDYTLQTKSIGFTLAILSLILMANSYLTLPAQLGGLLIGFLWLSASIPYKFSKLTFYYFFLPAFLWWFIIRIADPLLGFTLFGVFGPLIFMILLASNLKPLFFSD